jgi:cytochrome c oxidase subunit 1
MNRGVVELGGLVVLLVGCLLIATVSSRRRPLRADGAGYVGPGHREQFGLDLGSLRAALVRWTTTVDHKDIGILYIVFGTVAALWGGMDAMMLRLELLTPAANVWSEQTYNALFTTHGLTMLIFFVLPVFFGIGNYFLPLLIGADDMAFPRINAIAFWLLPPALLLARAGLFFQVGAQVLGIVMPAESLALLQSVEEPGVGWTLYTPLSSTTENPQITTLLLGLHLSGVATTLGAINFIVTVIHESAPDVNWANLDIFSWNILVTSGLALFAFPLLGSALVMLILDRVVGTTFYAVEGGSPVLWQHLFWFWGHPEVYILFLPATGLMSQILPKFVGRKLFGFRFIVYSTLAIGVLSFGVWAHHMFTSAVDPRVKASFMAVSIAIAVPSAIKTFNWLTTIWDGRVRITAPLVLCVGSIGMFVVGGVTGVFLAAVPVDIVYHGTYYVVGHFHMIVVGIIPFMMMAASYYWYPLITGRMYDRRLALFQSALVVGASTVTFVTLIVLGLLELPRRYANYPAEFAPLQQVASIGAFVIGVAALLWLYNMVWSYWNGDPVETADPWNLKATEQFTREWQWFEDRLEQRYDIAPAEPETVRPSSTTDPEVGSPQVSRGVGSLAENVGLTAGVGMLAGFVGTLLMSGALFAATVLGVFDTLAFAELAELAGFGEQVAVGYAVFLLGGTTTWALLFVALAEYLPGRLTVVTGLAYATVMAAGFMLAFYTGQTGLELVGYVVFSLVAHWLYGLGLAVTLELYELRRGEAL